MPVYTLASHAPLSGDVRQAVAHAITDIHCNMTGAPSEFVNVIFMHNHSIKDNKTLGVICNVRSGGNRNQELTDALAQKIHEGVAGASSINMSDISVSLLGFPASWALEGGEILPEPGDETSWLARKKND